MEFYYGVLNFTRMTDFTYCKQKAVRIVTCNSYFAHSEPLFKQLGPLKTCDIYKCQLLKFIFKLTHKQLPQYFEQFTFTFRNQLHNYATRTCQNVLIPNINHGFAKRSIGSLPQEHITQPMETSLTKYTLIVLLDFVYM